MGLTKGGSGLAFNSSPIWNLSKNSQGLLSKKQLDTRCCIRRHVQRSKGAISVLPPECNIQCLQLTRRAATAVQPPLCSHRCATRFARASKYLNSRVSNRRDCTTMCRGLLRVAAALATLAAALLCLEHTPHAQVSAARGREERATPSPNAETPHAHKPTHASASTYASPWADHVLRSHYHARQPLSTAGSTCLFAATPHASRPWSSARHSPSTCPLQAVVHARQAP